MLILHASFIGYTAY